MNKIMEGTQADVELENALERTGDILQDLDSWVNHSPNYDFHSISLLKSGKSYFLVVDFGLTKSIWRITMSELRQLRSKDDIEGVAEFIDRMASEPIIDRSGEV